MTDAHVGISGFGGAFLLLVGLTFFFDDDREHMWLKPIEAPLAALSRIPFAPYIATALAVGGPVADRLRSGTRDFPHRRFCRGSRPISWSS